jgi:hypothetical protein
MDCMGAAMMYQHATTEASRLIADSINSMIQRAGTTMIELSRTVNGTLMA